MGKIGPVQTDPGTTRRDILKQITGAAAAVIALPYMSSRSAFGEDSGDKRVLGRDSVVNKLGGGIRDLLDEVEKQTGLTVEFRALDREFAVVAQYGFRSPKQAVIRLRSDWEDVDAAHELMHMKLELVDGHPVLAWRRDVERDKTVEMAFGLIRSYTDDILVFDQLVRMGLTVDGQIIKHQFFDDICTKVPKYLRQGRSPANDGMAHLDNIAGGRYADLRRSAFLIQAELIASLYGEKLTDEHNRLLKDFISAFRQFRADQADKADKVLGFFNRHNIKNVKGHAKILRKWAALEGLNKWGGLSSYVRTGDGFTLPFPSDRQTRKRNRKR